jgi:signal transduction histidine kinase
VNTNLQPASRVRPRLLNLVVKLARLNSVNIVCALVVTYLMRIGVGFWSNLVFSICIGTIAAVIIDGGRRLMWGDGAPPKIPFFILLAAAVPIAYFGGTAIAIRLLGLPADAVFASQSNNAVGILILTVLACVAVTWLFWSRSKMAALAAAAESEKARAAAIERQAMQAQLQLLQAQIEPHMLFNTLANLQGLIAIDPERAQHMLEQLIVYLRATLSSSRAEKTTLAHEFALMRAYLELMSVRMGARLTYSLQWPEEVQHVLVPPMLLQPLVENAIKHGLEPNIDGGHIDIRARQEGSMLKLTVTDSGLGLDAPQQPQPTHGTHVGLANVRERLQAMYGAQAAFSLLPNHPSGVIAELTIPL